MRQVDQIGLAKAILWEEAKGKLRAIVMADGQTMPDYTNYDPNEKARYEIIEDFVNKFIDEFESHGYQE